MMWQDQHRNTSMFHKRILCWQYSVSLGREILGAENFYGLGSMLRHYPLAVGLVIPKCQKIWSASNDKVSVFAQLCFYFASMQCNVSLNFEWTQFKITRPYNSPTPDPLPPFALVCLSFFCHSRWNTEVKSGLNVLPIAFDVNRPR